MALMHTYSVFLTRDDSSASPLSNIRIGFRAPDNEMAKQTAAIQFPGYRSVSAARLLNG